jgi:hypothetical protein
VRGDLRGGGDRRAHGASLRVNERRQPGGVPVCSRLAGALSMRIRIRRGPRREAVDVAVEQAEGRGNEHRVVNLVIRRTCAAGPRDIRVAHLTASTLDARGEREQGFQLWRDRGLLWIHENRRHELFVVVQMTGGNRRVAVTAERAFVQPGHVRADQFALAGSEASGRHDCRLYCRAPSPSMMRMH